MTTSLWSNLPRLEEKIEAAKNVFLVLDFDGTLAPLVDQPSRAHLPDSVRRRLSQLADVTDVAVLSGRSLADVRRRVGIRSIVYGGNHGIEMLGPGVRYLNPAARRLKKHTRIFFLSAQRAFKDVPGVHIESKGFGLSLHYRHVPKTHLRLFQNKLTSFKETTHATLFHWTKGHFVSEMRPQTGWDKGKALRHLWSNRGKPFVLCIGDDVTDEDMFRAVPPPGNSIKVGKGKTQATYRLSHQKEITRLLTWAVTLLKEKVKKAPF